MYVTVGSYGGNLAPLVEQASRLELGWNPPGWGGAPALTLAAVGAEVIPGTWRLAMLVGMKPGSYIPFHCDHPAEENGLSGVSLKRVHLVLATNPQCWSFHDGYWQRLSEGGLYQMDPSKEHASINLGATTRLHLVVDVEV